MLKPLKGIPSAIHVWQWRSHWDLGEWSLARRRKRELLLNKRAHLCFHRAHALRDPLRNAIGCLLRLTLSLCRNSLRVLRTPSE